MTKFISRRRLTWLVFVLCLSLNVFLVVTRGAWESDLGGDPDEAAHAVTSLMLRDYMAGGVGRLLTPTAFAQQFYENFPKVALGHYPPGYYLLAGLWLLPLISIPSLLVLQAVLVAGLGALTYRVASKMGGRGAGVASAALIAVLPESLQQLQLVMSDTLVTLLGLWAALLWRDYLNKPNWKRSVAFGLAAAAAILTKGSAMGLCVIPPLATVFAGRWRLLKTPSWWLCGLPVVLLAAPWMLYSSKITAEGMLHLPLKEFLPEAARYYLRILPDLLGWPLALAASAGVLSFLVPGSQSQRGVRTPLTAALISHLVGTLLIVLLVPAGLTGRYLLPLMLMLIVSAVMITLRVACLLPPLLRGIPFLILAGGLMGQPWPQKEVNGFGAAVKHAGVPDSGSRRVSWLVASDPRGEGAIIAAAAFQCSRRAPSSLRVWRGSKQLATSDWMGRGYKPAFGSSAELLQLLDKLQVTRVFLDLSVSEDRRQPHERQLLDSLQSASQDWRLEFEQPIHRKPGETGTLRVYQRVLSGGKVSQD